MRLISVTNNKPIYLFMHLPKTAGTSMRNLLAQNYSREQLVYVYPERQGVWLDTIEQYGSDKLDGVRMMYGHFHFGIHDLIDGYPTKYITMLRDPVQRVISTFYHYRAVLSYRRIIFSRKMFSKKIDITDFISQGEYLEADNAMVRMISGVEGIPFGKCTDEIYDLAINNINKYFSTVLIMERMDESIAILQELLDIDKVAISRDNVNKHKKKDSGYYR